MKKIILIIFLLTLLFNNDIYSQKRTSGFKSSYKSKIVYKIPKIMSSTAYKLPKVKSNYNYESPVI